MGNEQSTYADIPVYYQKGHGVSLYKPAENLHISTSDGGYGLRKRKREHDNEVPAGVTEELLYSDDSSCNGQPDVPHRNHVRDFRDLRIEIDESGFIEDENEIDGNPPSLSNSLKGNFSPRSLYEKTRQFNNVTSDSDNECACLKENADSNSKTKDETVRSEKELPSLSRNDSEKNVLENEIKENSDKTKHNTLTPNGDLESSSVLLTPPPEDELSSTEPLFTASSAGVSLHSTKSDVSDIHSEVVDSFSKFVSEPDERLYNHDLVDGGALTDDDQESLSPLPFDHSAEKSHEKRLHMQALILKLNELKSRSRCNSESSPSKTSTSNTSLEHRRVSSLGGSNDSTFSGVSSPELELLNRSTKKPSVVTSGTFDSLEGEIHEVEDEFVTISSQLEELANKCSNCDTSSNAGLEILDGIYKRYPSIRVRHKDKGIQNINFELSNYTEGDTTLDSDLETDGVDLSWDLDNILDMLYSESSDSSSMQNPLVKKLKKEQAQRSESCSPVDFLEKTSFNSSVELDGSLYEDDFHLQLGMLPFAVNTYNAKNKNG